MLADSEENWRQALVRLRPRYAALFEDNFNYLSKMCLMRMREAAFTMLAMAREKNTITIICGSDASDHPQIYLHSGARFVIRGEGEQTLAELLKALEGHQDADWENIQGLSWLDSQGQLRQSANRDPLENLDLLPRPAWDLVDVERYRRIWLDHHGYFSMNAVTTRGCPYRCNWCAKPIWGNRYHSHSPARVAQDLAWLKTQYQPDHIWFADDIFGLKPGWLRNFAEALEKYQARIPFKCLLRADLVTDAAVKVLCNAGCQNVWMGAESGSQKILDAMDKGLRVGQIQEATSRLKAAGIRVGLFLQLGYPQETRQDIWSTIAMARLLMPEDLGISVSYPLPGTLFYERVRNDLTTKRLWQDSDDLAMLYQGPYSTKVYRQIHRFIHQDIILRRSWIAARNESRVLKKLRRAIYAALHALRWLPRRLQIAWALQERSINPSAQFQIDDRNQPNASQSAS